MLGAVRSVENYILWTTKKTRHYCFGYDIFPFIVVYMFDVAREAFERHLLNLNRLRLEDRTATLSLCCFLFCNQFCLLFSIIWRHIDNQLDVISTLTNIRPAPLISLSALCFGAVRSVENYILWTTKKTRHYCFGHDIFRFLLLTCSMWPRKLLSATC